MLKIGISALFCLALGALCFAQTAARLSPRTRAFVKEDAPVLAIRHVRVIDGTVLRPVTIKRW